MESIWKKMALLLLNVLLFVSSFSINEDDTEVKAYFPGCDGATMWETTKAKNKDKNMHKKHQNAI